MSIITQLLTTIPTQVIPTIPTIAGTAYGGGYYAGRIKIGTSIYALVVAPKATGQTGGKAWKTSYTTTAGTLSVNNGWTNTNSMNISSNPAAQWCRSLLIGGFTDWYLPSRDELEVCYRNLKPATTTNVVYPTRSGMTAYSGNGLDGQGNGDNDYAVDLIGAHSAGVGSAYTTVFPTQTSIALFKTGGSECFESAYHWASTECNAEFAWNQNFSNGHQRIEWKNSGYYTRAVRKILIS